jgi:rhodanese-related sulfurtransferase
MQTEYSRFKKYLETAVNVSLILVCLTLVAVLARNYLFPAKDPGKTLAKGDRIKFTSAEWENRGKTLLLFMRSGCQFCSESAAFYKEITSETASLSDVKIAAVFSPKDTNGENYLRGLGLETMEFRQADFGEAGVSGTPTAVLVDEKGYVQEFWRGFLSPGKRVEVKQKLGLAASSDFLVEKRDLEKLKNNEPGIVILDVRDRDSFSKEHLAGAKNIPLDELSVRAINELTVPGPVAVFGAADAEANSAYDVLINEGFRKVYILTSESN